MSILLTGAAGQLGRELTREFVRQKAAPTGGRIGGRIAGNPLLHEALRGPIFGVDRKPSPAACDEAIVQDLSDLDATEQQLARLQPRVVINAAAWTAVDAAEDNQTAAFRLNAELPGMLARWCGENGAFLLHYSTDYVFDGQASRPYTEADQPHPASAYGRSKRAGEEVVLESRCRHVVLRSSWLYSAHGQNFLLTMLKLAAERSELRVVDDQIGCPTWARNLARASRLVLEKQLGAPMTSGLMHYCDGTVSSWYGFAEAIFAAASAAKLLDQRPQLHSVASSDYPTAAPRPMYSVLDTATIRKRYGVKTPPLEASLTACLAELNKGK